MRKLEREECIARLGRARIGRVAVTIDALPVVRTVQFALAEEAVVLRVHPESRLRKALSNAVVAFHADHYDETAGGGWSIVVQGIAEPIDDPGTLDVLRSLPLDAWSDPPHADCFVRLPVTLISGEEVVWSDLAGESVGKPKASPIAADR